MNLWERLLFVLGIRRSPEARLFALEEKIHTALVDLAAQSGEPAEKVQAELLASALEQRQASGDLWNCWKSLTWREQQVCALVCLGSTNRMIAGRLGVTEGTVKSHIRNVLVKFDLHAKAELRLLLRGWDFSGWE